MDPFSMMDSATLTVKKRLEMAHKSVLSPPLTDLKHRHERSCREQSQKWRALTRLMIEITLHFPGDGPAFLPCKKI